MTPLECYAALTEPHWTVFEAAIDLEFAWGDLPRVRNVAERCGLSEQTVRACCRDLARVRLVAWMADADRVSAYSSLPVLGVID